MREKGLEREDGADERVGFLVGLADGIFDVDGLLPGVPPGFAFDAGERPGVPTRELTRVGSGVLDGVGRGGRLIFPLRRSRLEPPAGRREDALVRGLGARGLGCAREVEDERPAGRDVERVEAPPRLVEPAVFLRDDVDLFREADDEERGAGREALRELDGRADEERVAAGRDEEDRDDEERREVERDTVGRDAERDAELRDAELRDAGRLDGRAAGRDEERAADPLGLAPAA